MIDPKILDHHRQEVLQRRSQPRSSDGEVDVGDLRRFPSLPSALHCSSLTTLTISGHDEGPRVAMCMNMEVRAGNTRRRTVQVVEASEPFAAIMNSQLEFRTLDKHKWVTRRYRARICYDQIEKFSATNGQYDGSLLFREDSRPPWVFSRDINLELGSFWADRPHCTSQPLRKTEGLLIDSDIHLPRRNIRL